MGALYAPVKARDAAARCHWPRRSEACLCWAREGQERGVATVRALGPRACAHRERFWAQAARWLRVPTPPSEASLAVAVWPLAARHPLWAWLAPPPPAPPGCPLTQRTGQKAVNQDIRETADRGGEVCVERHVEGVVAELGWVAQSS